MFLTIVKHIVVFAIAWWLTFFLVLATRHPERSHVLQLRRTLAITSVLAVALTGLFWGLESSISLRPL